MKKTFIAGYGSLNNGNLTDYVFLEKGAEKIGLVDSITAATKWKSKKKALKDLNRVGISAIGYISIIKIYILKTKTNENKGKRKKTDIRTNETGNN